MKKIIIIGATSGIGRGLAEVYSQEDYLIGITGRRENLLEEVCARDKDKLPATFFKQAGGAALSPAGKGV